MQFASGLYRTVAMILLCFAFLPNVTGASIRTDRWRWSNPLPHGNNVMDMVVTSGFTAQVGDSGSFYLQGLDERWAPAATGVTNYLRALALLGSRFIAVGEEGCILWSDDGRGFQRSTVPGISGQWFEGVAASSQKAVAVGDEGYIYTSTDGISWAKATSGTTQWLRSVAFGGGSFVAVGENGKICRSTGSGTAWSAVASGTTAHLNRVRYLSTSVGNVFIAVGTGGTVIYSSTGTNNWTSISTGLTNTLFDVAANNTGILVTGDQDILYRATGSGSWVSQVRSLATNAAPAWTYCVASGASNSWVIAGRSGMLLEASLPAGSTSYSWQAAPDSSHAWLWDATVQKGIHVAVGDLATIQTSLDGILWAREVVPGTRTNVVLLGVGGSTNLLLSVGNSGNVFISYAGLTNVTLTNYVGTNVVVTNTVTETLGAFWNVVPPFTTNTLQGVAWNGSLYCVCGDRGLIYNSLDGTSWALRETPTTNLLSSVATHSGGWVVCGAKGTMLKAGSDAEQWTLVGLGTTNWLYKVRNLGGWLIAVGQNGAIFTSQDGNTWTARTSGTKAWLNDVAWVDGKWVAVGTQGTMIMSTDLVNWSGLPSPSVKSFYAATASSGKLLAFGIEGAIARNQVQPFISSVNFLGYDLSLASSGTGQMIRTNIYELFLLGGLPDQFFQLQSAPGIPSSPWITNATLELFDPSGTLYMIRTRDVTNGVVKEFYRTQNAE